MSKKPTGFVIYEGPSLIDGAPIVCVATVKSRNGKTGNMVQTWILRADMPPIEANRIGADFSICGSCPLKGIARPEARSGLAAERRCYVTIVQAPTVIWKAWKRGIYPRVVGHTAIAEIGRDRMVRVGAYGDGAAIPSYVNESLLSESEGHTAYSHQSGVAGSSFDGGVFMVSAGSEAEARAAWNKGWRTFRVLAAGEAPVPGREIDCPSSRGVHCKDCGLCKGAHPSAKSITIPAHGSGAVYF